MLVAVSLANFGRLHKLRHTSDELGCSVALSWDFTCFPLHAAFDKSKPKGLTNLRPLIQCLILKAFALGCGFL